MKFEKFGCFKIKRNIADKKPLNTFMSLFKAGSTFQK